MSNINKILIAVVSCVFMICVASVSIVSIVTSNEKETTTTTDAPPSQYSPSDGNTTDAPAVSEQNQNTSQPTSANIQTESTTNPATTSSTTQTVVTGDLAADILGFWKDSAGLFAYEFLDGGKVNVTYFDLAGFGVPLSGTAPGLYTLEGDTLTIKFSIHVATIKDVYRISINQNELSMYDLEDHESSTFMRVS